MDELDDIIEELESNRNEENIKGMARFGINPENALGVKIPVIREIAKQYKKQHQLALKLWENDIHEAKILASMIADPAQVTENMMETWVRDFNSWDLCDQVVMNLFEKRTDLGYRKAYEWSSSEEVFVKRAGLVLMARLAFTDRKADDQKILDFLPVLKLKSDDGRNFVMKACSWAIRQIGKRNMKCHHAAIECAKEIQQMEQKAAKWIATDVIRELTNEKTLERLRKRS